MTRRAIPGRSVRQALKQAAQRLRTQQAQCQASLQKLDASTNEFVERRGHTLMELAEHYLPEIRRETVLSAFRGIRAELLEVLARKQQREDELHDALQHDEAEAVRLQDELEQVTDQLNEKVDQREQLEEIVAERLKANEDFQVLSKQALSAEQELERNEERIAEIKQEAEEKLPAYDDSRLFRYLYDRGYGTSEYQKEGMTRELDRWIAKLVKFERSKRSYDFLRVTPELMATEVARRRDQFNVLMEKIEAIEEAISDEVGLTEVLREGQQLGTLRDGLVSDLADLEREFTSHHQELLALEGRQNEFYELGVTRMKAFLADMQQSWLEHQSRSTPERQDDELVAEIGWLNEQLDGAKRQSSDLLREQRNWDLRSEGLHDVIKRFLRADFDSRRSIFSDDLEVERLLEDYLHGELGREELWSVLRRYQQFQRVHHDRRDWDDDSWDGEDLGGVLGRVLIEVAGEAMKHAVRRGMRRRGPYRHNYQQKHSRPQLPTPWWFTRGKGF